MEKEYAIINALLKGTIFSVKASSVFADETMIEINGHGWMHVSNNWTRRLATLKTPEELVAKIKDENLIFSRF